MDDELRKRLDANDKVLQDIYRSTERTRKYILWTGIISLALFILPLIALGFVIPAYIKTLDFSSLGL